MDFEIITEGAGEITIYHDQPQELKRLSKIPAHCYTLHADSGKASLLYYQGKGYTISYNDYLFGKYTVLKARSPLSLLELNIPLGFPFSGTWDGIAQPELRSRQFQLCFTPFVNTRAIFLAGKKYRSFDIHFEKPFLQDIAADYPLLAEFLEIAEKGDAPSELSFQKNFCNFDMLAAIRFIEHNVYSPRSQERLIRDKVEEILIAALEITEDARPAPTAKLLPHEADSLKELKLFIESCPLQLPTIGELATSYALNRDKLKKGFKQLFGVSIYDYYLQIKMEKASLLLLTSDKTVTEIAYETGYHYDSAFCLAFKNMFGCQPLYFRKYGKKRI